MPTDGRIDNNVIRIPPRDAPALIGRVVRLLVIRQCDRQLF